jgi:predicted oxidoreductase (fatty acid repression mutant protein)
VTDEEIVRIIHEAVKHVPSAYNSQSTQIVLLLGDEHRRLWDIVKSILKMMLPEEIYAQTEKKIERSFANGYGTVLFFEDTSVVNKFEEAYPLYRQNFKTWSQHTSAMHQFTIWTMLEDLGFGASLQHYNPLIDSRVAERWSLPPSWRLVAQMPFGTPLSKPEPRQQHLPLSERLLIFSD